MKRRRHVDVALMTLGAKGEERKAQKEILMDIYPEYSATKHSKFVSQYNGQYVYFRDIYAERKSLFSPEK